MLVQHFIYIHLAWIIWPQIWVTWSSRVGLFRRPSIECALPSERILVKHPMRRWSNHRMTQVKHITDEVTCISRDSPGRGTSLYMTLWVPEESCRVRYPGQGHITDEGYRFSQNVCWRAGAVSYVTDVYRCALVSVN